MHAHTSGNYDNTIDQNTKPSLPGCTVKLVSTKMGARSTWFNMKRDAPNLADAGSSSYNVRKNTSEKSGWSFSE